MGKDLKGKELGTGLRQRKDGRYEARAKINGIDINLYDVDLKKLKILPMKFWIRRFPDGI